MPDALLAVYNAVPRVGVYERDLLAKMLARYSQPDIEGAIALLANRNFIKKAGCAERPIYVRLQTAKIVHRFIEENTI